MAIETVAAPREEANIYGLLDWPIFPVWPIRDGRCGCGKLDCGSPGKHPVGHLAPHGVKDAATDPDTIERWWNACPDANVGLATGERSGLFVVDIDPRNGGDVAWPDLVDRHGLPDTPQSQTGGGGSHFFFRHVAGLGNTTGRVGPGVDTKGDGGYVILPPSSHISGNRYIWLEGCHAGDMHPAALPAWLLALLVPTAAEKANGRAAEPIGDRIAAGGRNARLASLAGTMRRRGATEPVIAAALHQMNQGQCDPPLPDEEIIVIAASVASYQPAANGAGPEGQPADLAAALAPLRPQTMADLLAQDFPPLTFLVDGLLAKGHLAVLGGRPKSGKSWLVLQLAQAIDSGRAFLGRDTMRGRVLYVALEDGARRVHQRAKILRWQPVGAAVLFQVAHFDGDGLPGPGLAQLWQLAPEFDLIIVDTLVACLSGRANENDNVQMGLIVNELGRLAHSTEAAILLLHHTTKAGADDVFNLLRGASAIRGGYDLGLLLERKPGEREAVLHMESRDFDLSALTIRQADNGAGWEALGDGLELTKIRAGRRAVAAMMEHGDGLTAEELAALLKVTRRSAAKQLEHLERDGLVARQAEDREGSKKPVDVWSLKS